MIKVVIADDEKRICKLVQVLADWESMGMEVVGTAENGLEALELVRAFSPDILITDIRMPGCDGLELIRQAKEIQKGLEIIVISGYAHFEYAQSAIKYGVGNYLLKPIKKDELMETLRSMKERLEKRMEEEEGKALSRQNSLRDRKSLRNSLVKELLSDHPTALTREILKESYYIEVCDSVLQAFLIKIDCDTTQIKNSALELLQSEISGDFENVLEEVCAERVLHFQDYTGYGILIYPEEKRPEVRKGMREWLNRLDAKKRLFGEVEISLALGRAVKEPEELPASMSEAKRAVKERLMEGTGRMFESTQEGNGMARQNLLNQYAKTVGNALEAFDAQAVEEACRMLWNTAEEAELSGADMVELVCSAGRFFVSRTAVQDAEQVQREFAERCEQCSSVKQLFELLQKEQKQLFEEQEEARKSEATRPIRLAKQYVTQHYREQITLEEVCELVGFSSSYFSVLFKKETGEGFVKYLTRVRMEEAKTLLRETNLSVAEICEAVGYNDRKHFTQTFHKMSGLNPADYRKLYG